MEAKYIKAKTPTETPCLMKNQYGEVFLVTDGVDKNYFVTRISAGGEEMETWESDLKDYKPLPEGAKFEFTN